MVNKTTSFMKKGNGKKGNFKNDKQVVTPVKKTKARPKPETKCFYCKGKKVTRSGTALDTWRIRRMAY